MLKIAQAMGQIVQFLKRQFGLIDDGIGRVQHRVLAEQSDFHVGGDGNAAVVGDELAGEDFKERGFPRAIGPDKPHAFGGVDGEVQFVEQHAPPEVLFNIAKLSQRHDQQNTAQPPRVQDWAIAYASIAAAEGLVQEFKGSRVQGKINTLELLNL